MMSEKTDGKPTIDPENLLASLEEVAAKLNINVRYENIVGGPIKATSGSCKIRGEEVILIDRRMSTMEKLFALGKELQRFNLENLYIPPAARKFLQRSGDSE